MLQLDGFPTGDGVKADRSAGRLTGSMMELQTLQEALKVEIQIHQKLVAQMKQDPQNADLKKQLHELQAKITALSEKQKKVVEQLRKELLVKQEPEPKLQLQSGTITAEVKPTALLQTAQVTAGITQTLTVTPVLTAKTLPLVLKAAAAPTLTGPVLSPRPATVAMVTTAITKPDQNTPINLQVASKLTNQSGEPVRLLTKSTMLVRPKPVTPTNVPIAPAPPPPMMAAPQLLQRPVMLATKLATSLPSATPIHQVRIVNGQPCAKTGTTPLTGIVITTPVSAATRLASPTHPHTPLPLPTGAQAIQISSIATEPKPTVKAVSAAEPKVITPVPSSATPPPSPAPRPKREENPEKLAFMVSLGLVTHDHLEEIQSKRQERKRRTTANPVYSGAVFEPERKKSAVSYLNSPLHQGTRKRANEDSLSKILKKEEAIPWPGTLAIVHSYIAYKEAKEEEKQKLMKWSSELKLEREQLEQKVKQLSNSITKCMETKNSILARQKDMQHSLDKVKHLIRLIQAFNFNQAQREPKEDPPKLLDCPLVPILPKPEVNSVATLLSTDSAVNNSEDKHKPTPISVVSTEVREVKEVTVATEGTEQANSVPSADNSDNNNSAQQPPPTGEVSNAGTTETPPTADTTGATPAGGGVDNTAPLLLLSAPPPPPVITTNGTTEPACPEHSPAANPTHSSSSENKMAATTAVIIAAETTQEAPPTTNNNNNNNSKTSAPSQHCLPALVSSSDTDK